MTAANLKVHGQSSDDNGVADFSTTTYPSGSSYATLAEYLWKTPFIFNGRFDDDTQKAIITECYQSLWQHDPTLMQQYFFSNQKEFQDAIYIQLQNRNGKEYPKATIVDASSLVWHSNAIVPLPDLSNEHGRQCGYVFRKGEPIYRCRKEQKNQLTCGLDDSSVFCSRCFHATNHDGHDVLFAVSQGSGGCCDCGDSEAWKIPLQCNIHISSNDDNNGNQNEKGALSEKVPKKVIDAIRTNLSAVLDFILDTFALGPEEMSLSASPNELTRAEEGSNKISTESVEDTLLDQDDDVDMDHMGSSNPFFSSPFQRTSDTGGEIEHRAVVEEYVCIAWNDEGHAFSHVLECLQAAKECRWEEAKELVEAIHLHGRKVIATSTSIEQLRKIAAPLAAINLGVSIRTARDVYREDVCSLLIYWLKELTHGHNRFFADIPNGDAIVRTILCEELCTDWKLRGSSTSLSNQGQRNAHTVHLGDDEDMNENSMGTTTTIITPDMPEEEDIEMLDPDTAFMPQHKESIPGRRGVEEDEVVTKTSVASIDWHPAVMMHEFQSLRTNELLVWDEIMTNANGKGKSVGASSMGKKITPEMIPSAIQREFERKFRLDYLLLADLKLWKEIRVALRELYITSLIADTEFRKVLGKRLARNYARLAESFLLKDREPESSIILFSVQLLTVPSVADLLVNQYDFFGLICSSLTAFFLTDRLYLVLPSERERYPARVNCESRAFRTRRYFNAFHDLRYIMNVEMIQPVLAQDPLYLRQFLDLISMFQCMNAQICQKDAHVEYESEIWVNAFNVTLQIGKCCRQFAVCFGKLRYSSSTSTERIAATRTLVRAITCILRTIDAWGSEPDDMRSVDDNASSRKTRPATQQPGVGGPGDQAYHTFRLPYIDQPVKVLQYDITSQPVSFHHPLHWLLAFILEHTSYVNEEMLIEAGFPNGYGHIFSLFKTDDNSKAKDGTASDDLLLPIIEYPIRTVAFSAQIRAGVWVRNGYGIRNQALHYRDVSLRENTFDADLFLLQLGLATIEPNQYLTTLMDRFGLVNWFLGDREHPLYDGGQSTFMVEELLNLLIVCICERTNIMGIDIESRIRREIIHNLCLNPITYSELIKRIPDRLHEHVAFDRLLTKLGQFKPPVGVNDTGSYSLNDEYYDEIDPYFYHYSRNNREEAIDMLNKRWKDVHPSKDPHHFFLLPKCTKITNDAFRYLGDFLHSTVFCQMMAYVFWNVRMSDNHKSDTNLEQALYLILLALTDENNRQCINSSMTMDSETPVDGVGDEDEEGDEGTKLGGFYRFVCDHYFAFTSDDHSQDLSLFDIMSIFRDDNKYQELHAQLDWIFEQLLSRGPGRTRRKVQKWREGKAFKMDGEDTESSGMTELEAKKLAAKERQKRIMAQFAQAQSQFIEQNEGLYDEDEDDEDDEDALLNKEKKDAGKNDTQDSPQNDGSISRLCAYPTGTCIVCQEEVSDKSAPYGMLAFIQTSNIIREAHASQEDEILSKFSQNNGSLDIEWPDEQQQPSENNGSSMPGYPAHLNKTGLYTSTCSHLMHIRCFEVYCQSIDSRHTTQLTRNHPENRARNEFMCPLCKSLGNILLPVYWKGRKEMYPGPVLHNETFKYYNFLRSNVQPGIDRLKQAIINRSQRRRSNGSKLKEAFSTFVPSLRTTPPSGSISASSSTSTGMGLRNEDEWQTLRRPPITNIELPSLFQHEGSTSTPIITSSSASSSSASAASVSSPIGNIYIDRRFGPFDSDIMHPSTSANLPSVSKMYVRVFEVISTIYQEICSDDNIRDMSTHVQNIDLLWGLLGYTIAGVEIATRGQSKPTTIDHEDEENSLTDSLFDQIPPQTRMLLRILCDSILAYTCIMCHQEPGASRSSASTTNPGQTLIRVHLLALARLRQVFADIQVGDFAHLQGLSYERMIVYDNLPLLQDDPFMVLTELTFHGIPFAKMSVHILMRVLLLAELTKTVVAVVQEKLQLLLSQNSSLQRRSKDAIEEEDGVKEEDLLSDEQIEAIKSFTMFIMEHLKFTPQEAMAVYESIGAVKLYALLQSFGLPFLRRTMILMIVRYGYIPSPKQQRSEANEFERLLDLLWLPELPELIELKSENEQLISTWCSHHVTESERTMRMQEHHHQYDREEIAAWRLEDITLDMPTPLQLIPLPMKLEHLIDESLRRVCTKCNSVPTDPAVCLLCGTFVCTQSFCCAEDEEGECNLHRLECGGEIGLYLSVKRCVVILLYNGNGWFVNAPYLDPHGEVGQGLRRGKPQYLNRKRYNEIRKLWLQHNIPVYIARQIEASYDVGGWLSL